MWRLSRLRILIGGRGGRIGVIRWQSSSRLGLRGCLCLGMWCVLLIL